MSQQGSSLPLFFKNGRALGVTGGGRQRFREFNCLVILLVTFVLAWITLIAYIPEVQHGDVTFEDTYRRFASAGKRDGRIVSFSEVSLSRAEGGQETDGTAILNARSEESSLNDVSVSPDKTSGDKLPLKEILQFDYGRGEEGNGQKQVEPPSAQVNNSLVEGRRTKVKEMIKHAWDGYVRYAMGQNELKPMSRVGHSAGVFGKSKLGATLVDSLDTLYIAGMKEEFDQAKEWVEKEFSISEVNTEVSLFEFNIRFVGGFLSAYALSGEEVFKEKALIVVSKLLPAFSTATGLPRSLVNLQTGRSKNWSWAAGGSCVLSEVGSLHLEFQYLTEITKDPKYLNKVLRIRQKLKDIPKPDGLYSNFINPETGRWAQKHVSLGALGDSFYEYLVKSWVGTSKQDTEGLDMFNDAVAAMEHNMIHKKKDGSVMVTDFKNGRSDGKTQHLACFSGGMFALASQNIENDQLKAQHYQELAEGITATCHQSYARSPTHIGPEIFRIDADGSPISQSNGKMYLLRPETVESYFYMWRMTHDPKYREWGWDVVQALEKHCRVENGYSGLKDVFRIPPVRDDVQQSFFIAETLKYLYLLFSDDSVIPLDKWVFNTEAHPLPILPGIPKVDANHHLK